MNELLAQVSDLGVSTVGRIVGALLIFLIGKAVIRKVLSVLEKGKLMRSQDETLRRFLLNFLKIALYAVLAISVIGVIGVPMASVVAVLASCGLAVGMSVQGSLGNLAGGIMLMIFRPFNVGDYITAGGEEGTVQDISMFYTSLVTVDNRKIIIPNGNLMNSNVTNFSTMPERRVDLTFTCAKGEDVAKLQQIMRDVCAANPRVKKDPAPFAQLSGGTNEAMEFTVRVWTATADYWDAHFELIEAITKALGEAGVKAPAVRVISE